MALRNTNKITDGDLSYQRKRYTIPELLEMRRTLPYVCCPVRSFKPEAWSESILIKVVPAGDLLGPPKYNVKILANKLDNARRQEILSRQKKKEALDRLVIRKKHQSRGIPLKSGVMPTIPEVPSPAIPSIPAHLAAPTIDRSIMRSVPLNTGLSGGYGKKILPDTSTENGLMTSMHAFVPGGKLKTAPVIALDAGDSSGWVMKSPQGIQGAPSTLSLNDGLGFKNTSAPVFVTVTSPTANSVSAKERTPVTSKIKKIEDRAATSDATNAKANLETTVKAAAKSKTKTENKPPAGQPRALMGKRSTSAEQLSWIQIMMSKSIVSASQKAPQIKEALGAVTETLEDNSHFVRANEMDAYEELCDAKAAIVSGW